MWHSRALGRTMRGGDRLGGGAEMIRTGDEYRAGLRDGREIWIDDERVADVTMHPAFKPIVHAKARMYDLAHDCANLY